MWKPPQRIKFNPSRGRIPTRNEIARSLLFSPIRIGGLTIEQRTWVPAMVPWRATEDGFVGQDVLDWYACFAQVLNMSSLASYMSLLSALGHLIQSIAERERISK